MGYFSRSAKDLLSNTPAGGWLGKIPFVETAYGRHALFRTDHTGLFYGIYDEYDEALAHVPASRLAGWDNRASASIWADNIHQLKPYSVQPSSYAVLFWLLRLMQKGMSLVDLGGSIGLTYYRYLRFTRLPENARWIVVELPEIAAEGQRVAAREGACGLEFATAYESVPACDILLAAGALQYMKRSVPGLLEMRAEKPPHVILNKVSITSGEAYWTLQNFGPAVTPYRIYNEADFVSYFEKAGYILRDRWIVKELGCYVPFHPEKCVPEFAGFYFEKPS